MKFVLLMWCYNESLFGGSRTSCWPCLSTCSRCTVPIDLGDHKSSHVWFFILSQGDVFTYSHEKQSCFWVMDYVLQHAFLAMTKKHWSMVTPSDYVQRNDNISNINISWWMHSCILWTSHHLLYVQQILLEHAHRCPQCTTTIANLMLLS